MTETANHRRSLVLAGGGLKVAFQAGVLQVLLSEAQENGKTGLTFDHVDGASGGTFNLAMMCMGQSGTAIADNWRDFSPFEIIEPNPKLVLGESLTRLGRLKERGFRLWGLDFNAMADSKLPATFNVYDFSRHELVVLSPADMTPEMLTACVALPMWFPPVEFKDTLLIDPVYITDANLDEAIARGADEIWVVWTVSRKAHWGRGFINHYFQVIETSSYGLFKRQLARIEASNRAHEEGRHAEYDRRIDVKVLYAEVPVHYLINFGRRPFQQAVEQGVRAGRAWCAEMGIPTEPATVPLERSSRVLFTEEMAGRVARGETSAQTGAMLGEPFKFHLTIATSDMQGMLDDPDREARARGWIEAPEFGGRLSVQHGRFNLFVDTEKGVKEMRYRLHFADSAGHPLTLTGVKTIRDEPGLDLWYDTTSLEVELRRGHLGPAEQAGVDVIGAGVLKITPWSFARQLTTFRGSGPGPFGGLTSVARFGAAFLGHLTQIYGNPFRNRAL